MGDADDTLVPIKAALQDGGSIQITYVFGNGLCAQVMKKSRKVGPIIIPARDEGQSLADVLHMLGTMAEDDDSGANS